MLAVRTCGHPAGGVARFGGNNNMWFPVHEIDSELVTYEANNSREILVAIKEGITAILRANNLMAIQI